MVAGGLRSGAPSAAARRCEPGPLRSGWRWPDVELRRPVHGNAWRGYLRQRARPRAPARNRAKQPGGRWLLATGPPALSRRQSRESGPHGHIRAGRIQRAEPGELWDLRRDGRFTALRTSGVSKSAASTPTDRPGEVLNWNWRRRPVLLGFRWCLGVIGPNFGPKRFRAA